MSNNERQAEIAKHTPGLWTVEAGTDSGRFPVVSVSPERVDGDGNSWLVAHVWGYGEFTAEGLANARLIAAAPELLDALRAYTAALNAAVLFFNKRGVEQLPHGLVAADEAARAAIAKAEGRS